MIIFASVPLRVCRASRLLIVLGTLLSTAGCAHSPIVAHEAVDGSLLPGPHAASVLGIRPDVRLAEAVAPTLPQPVRDSAWLLAEQHRVLRECVRFFPADSVVIIVLPAFCGTHYGRETDSRRMAGLDLHGRLIGQLSWRPHRGVAELIPADRFDLTDDPPEEELKY